MSRYTSVVVEMEWLEVSRQLPCPVCRATRDCKVSTDRAFACCLNTVCEWPVVTGGWLHRLDRMVRDGVPLYS